MEIKKKILITGCNGFLGSNIIKELSKLNKYKLISTSFNKSDINGIEFLQGDISNAEFTESLINKYDPDIIINTVALADVDLCEENPENAYKLNVITIENIAKSIKRKDVKLFHISSDQLFDGTKSFYSEEDQTNPLNIYGKTKLDSEKACLNCHKNTIIVRTNFFGWSSKNHKPTFGEWVFNSLSEGEEIKMFNDIFFTPIEVSLLIKSIEKLFESDYKGILNLSGKERISKYEFGIRLAKKYNFDEKLITPISYKNFNFKANRQSDMSLSNQKYEKLFNCKLPFLDESLEKFKDNKKIEKVENAIIGAGLSGLSTAYYLEKTGNQNYILFESSSEIGGLAKSVKKNDFIFDLSIHMLHLRNKENIDLVKELLGDNLKLMDRKAGIFINKRIVPYPFQYNLYHLDYETKLKCINGAIEASQFKDINPKNFKELINLTQGKGIAESFMIPYNKKCYGIDTQELTIDCAGRYLPTPNIQEMIEGANKDMSDIKVGYNYQFYYTKSGGISPLAEAFAKNIRNIKLNEKIIKINTNKKLIFTNKGDIYNYNNLISTIPIKKLINLIVDAPNEIIESNKKLKGNTVGLVLMGINKPKICPYQWLYLPEEDLFSYRISFPMNYSENMAPPGTSSICTEYAYLGNNKLKDDEIIEKIIGDIEKIGLIKSREDIIFTKIIELDPAYVIFDFNRESNLKIIKEYINDKSIYSIGRFGAWEYSSMEEAINYGRNIALELVTKT